jgi:hypothetical protein
MAPTFESKIDLDLPESELVEAINNRLRRYRMELANSLAVFGEEVNFGKWFVRGWTKPSAKNQRSFCHLVQRHITPAGVAANLNLGVLPR